MTAAETLPGTESESARVAAVLAAPFDPAEVKYKPQSVKDDRALALVYVDARAVEDRLDAAVGVGGWQDEYEVLADGSVVCRLRLLIAGTWITKTDVGSPSEQPDGHDRMKAAFSDALKRSAVKFGVGRYLYRLPAEWRPYDPVKRQFVPPKPVPARPAVRPTVPPPPPKVTPAPKSKAELLTVVRSKQPAADGTRLVNAVEWAEGHLRRLDPAYPRDDLGREVREAAGVPLMHATGRTAAAGWSKLVEYLTAAAAA